jgi:hypothetical protein
MLLGTIIPASCNFSHNASAIESLQRISASAWNFFQTLTTGHLNIVQTEIGHDIELNSIEIGSYGWRQHRDIIWAYGTGLAEPRFSIANQSTSTLAVH